jgi:hypothetical protein
MSRSTVDQQGGLVIGPDPVGHLFPQAIVEP